MLIWLEQPFDRLKYLNIICDAIKSKKGGVFLSTLYAYSEHGDPFKSSMLKLAMSKCIIPIRDMIIEWIFDGQIRDAHEEVRGLNVGFKAIFYMYLFPSFF